MIDLWNLSSKSEISNLHIQTIFWRGCKEDVFCFQVPMDTIFFVLCNKIGKYMIFLIEIICLLQLSNTPMIFFKGSYHILNGRGNLCKHDFGFKFFVRSLFTRQPCKQLPSRGVFKNQVNSRNSFNDFIQPENRLLDNQDWIYLL